MGNPTAQVVQQIFGVHQQFERQVARTPEGVAVSRGGDQRTYFELNLSANRLAHELRARGIGFDDRVLVCMGRSPSFVIGLLAILKAGAAYVPLDPAYPAARLTQIYSDARPALLLTDSAGWQVLCDTGVEAERIIDVNLEGDRWSYRSADNPAPLQASDDNLAYVVYTSGSTGVPKGVAMPHRPLLNLLAWHCSQSRNRSRGVRTLQYAALGFDVAFQEIFSTLVDGGELVLIEEVLRTDPEALLAKLADEQIERLHLPYVALRNLAEAAAIAPGRLLGLRLREVFTAGEQLVVTDEIRRFFVALPECRLHNQYGPTETHVVTAYTLPSEPWAWPTLPSIGCPIPNTYIRLLDARGRTVSIGEVGEIHIGGIGLARGYMGRPELTEAQFKPDPDIPGNRLYRTGDLARWDADGLIQFLGRNDHQAKIRGFRVEPNEVKAHLVQHPEVREAAVVTLDGGVGEKRLVAYVVSREDRFPDMVPSLHAYLVAKLPHYMVPAAYVALSALPVTPNGKLDRQALPTPDDTAFVRPACAPPRDELERALAAMWTELLGLERIGRNDDFFDLGGSSMQALRLLSQIKATLGVAISPADLFQEPVLAVMADAIRCARANPPAV